MKVPPLESGGVLHSNEGVCVARVAYDDDLAVGVCALIQSTALVEEDLAILRKEVCALHSGATRFGSNHQGPVGMLKLLLGLNSNLHLAQEGVERVLKLHGHSLEGGIGSLTSQEGECNGLVPSIHLS